MGDLKYIFECFAAATPRKAGDTYSSCIEENFSLSVVVGDIGLISKCIDGEWELGSGVKRTLRHNRNVSYNWCAF